MVEDKKLILFFAVSLAIVVGWQMLVGPPPTPPPTEQAPVGETVAEELAPPTAPAGPEAEVESATPAEESLVELPPVAAESEERIVVESERFRAELTNRGGQLLSFRLHDYLDAEGEPLDLVRHRPSGPYPLALLGGDLEPLATEEELFAVRREGTGSSTQTVELEYRGAAGAASKRLRFEADGVIKVEVETEGQADWGLLLGPGILNPDPETMGDRTTLHTAIYRQGGDVTLRKSAKVGEVERLDGIGLSWVGLQETYFLSAFVATKPWRDVLLQPVVVLPVGEGGEGPAGLLPFTDEGALPAGLEDQPRDQRVIVRAAGSRIELSAYFGAKQYELLRSLGWGLEESVQWGMFGFLARPLLIGLEWIHDRVVSNYGWAIVLMTMFLKLVLYPLTHKSQVSMLKMQKLQPRMQAIRQKWRGKLRDKRGKLNLDAQRQMNEEIQELFRAEGTSPYGGCLPMLLQIPVFFAFFRLLLTAVELRAEPWVLWIEDLSIPDPLYVLPILMGASQIYQQRLTPMTGDPMQRRIMQMFPWIFTFVAFSFPSGLVLYWTVNNVLTIGQTMLINRHRAKADAGEGAKSKTKSKGKKGKGE